MTNYKTKSFSFEINKIISFTDPVSVVEIYIFIINLLQFNRSNNYLYKQLSPGVRNDPYKYIDMCH